MEFEDKVLPNLEDVPLVLPPGQEDQIKQMADFMISGNTEIHENDEFKQLLDALSKNQESKKPVTKKEIDWLVEKLSKIDSFDTR